MGGSSNTTNTSGGGKDKDKHADSPAAFMEGDRVLAYHGPLLYEAKVQKTENRENEWRYFVHYLGWNKNWDEWVASDRLLKLTEENVRKQQELEKNQAVDKNIKSGRSTQHKPKGSNDAKADKEDTKVFVKGKKRKSQLGTEEKERRSSESLIMSQFPLTLKKQLVDDWEFVTQLGKLVKLPRSPTVDDILKKYLEHRTKKDNKINDSYAEILKGLRCYFDKALPAMLLYKKERQQYTEEVKGDVSPSTVYGAEHLLRLFVNAMVGNRTWFGGLFNSSGKRRQVNVVKTFEPTPVQEQRLQKLKERLNVPYDETRPDHQEALRSLWNTSFPDTELNSLVSEQWKDMGWQGPNPSTDFRGCGFVSLENLLFFARTYPVSFQRLLLKQQGIRATWEYPFAVAGVNVSYMLIQLLELNSAQPKSLPGINFIRVLSEHEEAFDVLYCIAFEMMDAQWLAMRASYMQFKEVLEATKLQLERELSLEDLCRIHDLPAYNLLYK